MEMSEIYNGSQWAHDIFLVNKAGAKENITSRSSTLCLLKFHTEPLFLISSPQVITKPIQVKSFKKIPLHAGRNLWVLALGPNADRHVHLRPEVKYVGNMHGNEVRKTGYCLEHLHSQGNM